jgi:hypothetical protein
VPFDNFAARIWAVELLRKEDTFQATVLLDPNMTDEVVDILELIRVRFRSKMTESELGASLDVPLTL